MILQCDWKVLEIHVNYNTLPMRHLFFFLSFFLSLNTVTGWKGTRDKESSNQKPRRVDFINPCLRAWVVMPFGLLAVFSIVSRCG